MYLISSQSVIASSNSRSSCSRVPPKCSTKSSPKSSRAILDFLIKASVAAHSVFGRRCPFESAEADAARGGTGIASFFSIPRKPAANSAATLTLELVRKDYHSIMRMHVCSRNSYLQSGCFRRCCLVESAKIDSLTSVPAEQLVERMQLDFRSPKTP